MVLTKSPTSAVSPPELWIFIPYFAKSFNKSSVPLMIADKTDPGILFLFLPIVDGAPN